MNQVKATAREITKVPVEDKPQESSSEDSSDDELIGPPLPETFSLAGKKPQTNSDDSESDSDEDNDTDNKHFIPMSEQTSMRHGNKAVTALTVDPSGARLASGKSLN